MNYAIIGSGGFIAQRHKQCIKDIGGTILLTCDINKETNPDFENYLDMFVSPKFKEVDAIIICTPNSLHKQMVKDSLRTGKRVLCEKPLILDNNFEELGGVNTVLQLRYHSLTEEIKKELKSDENEIELVMRVYRDDKWWSSWRGDQDLNGNILIQLSIHMFDYLIFLLGNQYKIIESYKSRKLCTGKIIWSNTVVKYHVEILDNNANQTRSFIINGKYFELCDKDNLSFAGYHHLVHEDFVKGTGISVLEAMKSIQLINKL